MEKEYQKTIVFREFIEMFVRQKGVSNFHMLTSNLVQDASVNFRSLLFFEVSKLKISEKFLKITVRFPESKATMSITEAKNVSLTL